MIDRNKIFLNWWDKTKIVIGIIAFMYMIMQLVAGYRYLYENNTEVQMIKNESEYTTLSIGQEIAGEIRSESILMEFEGDTTADETPLVYYLIRVNGDNIIVVRTVDGSTCHSAMERIKRQGSGSIKYKARVNTLTDNNATLLNLNILTGNVLMKNGMSADINAALIRQVLDINLYESTNSERYIIATFIGAAIMLLIAVWAFKSSFKKILFQIGVKMGKVDLGLMTADDLPIEQGWFTDENMKGKQTDKPLPFVEESIFAPPPSDGKEVEKVDFYASGVNEEGNFYVQKEEVPPQTEENPDNPDKPKNKHLNY